MAELYRELGFGDEAAKPGARARAESAPAGKAAPLTPEKLRELQAEFERDPQGMLAIVSKSVGFPVGELEFRDVLAQTEHAFEEPASYARMLRRRREIRVARCNPPAGIPKDPLNEIEIDPCTTRFEGTRDWDGWAFHCGPWWLLQKIGGVRRAQFVRHSEASPFVYTMKDRSNAELRASDTVTMALFSDFGTGEYHSRFVAREIGKAAPHYAIHLGDVYYAGEPDEVAKYLKAPIDKYLGGSRVFLMNANHEMLSGGFGYFDYLAERHRGGAEQQGSYFCLESPGHLVIGLDTAYDYKRDGHLVDEGQHRWLIERLSARGNRKTILLTQHEPFGLGAQEPNGLLEEVRLLADAAGAWPPDFWFWGDEHYCVLYKKTASVPFVGSCIGHAGHPVDLRKVAADLKKSDPFAEPHWVDRSPRFASFRAAELGNAGYLMLELGPANVKLTYRSWWEDPAKPPPTFVF